uniref:Telomere length regulation protein conserved domain-containing protein n=1 Tax=Aegilops tauschii subsp. strangulata TaxID=200361 RepID=A0A452ZQI8_AEGTS
YQTKLLDDPELSFFCLHKVESALSSAEKLVRASPDELCHCSGDLVQARVHVPCFRVKVEGEEDPAEENRQKALVALLMWCSMSIS